MGNISQKVLKKIKIGSVKIENNFILAPMAGISDQPFRILAKEGGAGIVYTEMVSAKALSYADEKSKRLLAMKNSERPLAAQIFGADAESMSKAAKIVCSLGADIIDINLGCPVKKIAKSGAGAKLLANKELIERILTAVIESVNIPVTVKIRLGLAKGQNIAPEIVEIAQNCGIKMIAIHARYAEQGHNGEVDLKGFSDSCRNAKIPIFANGGIVDEKSAESFLNIENCSGLMIGRGAIANFSIFNDLKEYFENGRALILPTLAIRINWFKRYFEESARYYGEKRALTLMRKTAGYYIKDLPDAAKIRDAFNKIESIKEFSAIIKEMTINQ
ncbi:MAG: tRNA dihydrouridine synthase DusB [Endomicrobium sp.]|nr:tRNA dihydrouridine synthase DusB [Endomicrobium sp.]